MNLISKPSLLAVPLQKIEVTAEVERMMDLSLFFKEELKQSLILYALGDWGDWQTNWLNEFFTHDRNTVKGDSDTSGRYFIYDEIVIIKTKNNITKIMMEYELIEESI